MGREKAKKGKNSIVIWIVLFIVFVGAGFAGRTLIHSPIEHERVIDVKTLKAEVRQIHELATMQYDYREIVQKEKDGFLSNMFIATFDGTIKAGIDLKEVKYKVQNPEPESGEPPVVNITMPEAKILSHEDSNPETLYQEGYRSKGIGEERNKIIKDKKIAKQKEFIMEGHLDEAKTRAEKAITEFIQSAYGEDVVVNYTDAE